MKDQSPKIKAWFRQIESGQMHSNNARVLDFIIKYPKSNLRLIGRHLNLAHQTLTARLSDLEDAGVIEATPNGDYSEFSYIPDPQGQKLHQAKRAADKLEAWAKKGMGLEITPELKESLQHLISRQ